MEENRKNVKIIIEGRNYYLYYEVKNEGVETIFLRPFGEYAKQIEDLLCAPWYSYYEAMEKIAQMWEVEVWDVGRYGSCCVASPPRRE